MNIAETPECLKKELLAGAGRDQEIEEFVEKI